MVMALRKQGTLFSSVEGKCGQGTGTVMTFRQWLLIIVLAAGAMSFLGWTLYQWISPRQRALRRSRRGDFAPAVSRLQALIARSPSSPALHVTLGQVYLMAGRPEEAEAELRQSLALGSHSPASHAALGWALVQLGRLDEALPFAEEAQHRAHEDFEVYCLYCGLLAHHGRGAEVVPIYEFLRRRSVQLQTRNPRSYQEGHGPKFEFARAKMEAAGYV